MDAFVNLKRKISMVEMCAVWTGLEPATSCVTGMHSNQLNYQTSALSFRKRVQI